MLCPWNCCLSVFSHNCENISSKHSIYAFFFWTTYLFKPSRARVFMLFLLAMNLCFMYFTFWFLIFIEILAFGRRNQEREKKIKSSRKIILLRIKKQVFLYTGLWSLERGSQLTNYTLYGCFFSGYSLRVGVVCFGVFFLLSLIVKIYKSWKCFENFFTLCLWYSSLCE